MQQYLPIILAVLAGLFIQPKGKDTDAIWKMIAKLLKGESSSPAHEPDTLADLVRCTDCCAAANPECDISITVTAEGRNVSVTERPQAEP